jgi:transketolase
MFFQNEKRNMLVDNERAKLAEYENEYQQLLHEWKNSLPTRKTTLERKFAKELENQDRFYGVDTGLPKPSSQHQQQQL